MCVIKPVGRHGTTSFDPVIIMISNCQYTGRFNENQCYLYDAFRRHFAFYLQNQRVEVGTRQGLNASQKQLD
jgi:hypothetical protein